MKIRLALVSFVIVLAPSLALAQGCSHGKPAQEASISCADGTVFDAASGRCVSTTS